MTTPNTHVTLTIETARKALKEGLRERHLVYTGTPAWWENEEEAKALRASIGERARQILAMQKLATPPQMAVPEAAPVRPPMVEAPVRVVPELKPESEALVAARLLIADGKLDEARLIAWAQYPRVADARENKRQADRRRKFLIAAGAPAVGLRPGQVVFGRKIG